MIGLKDAFERLDATEAKMDQMIKNLNTVVEHLENLVGIMSRIETRLWEDSPGWAPPWLEENE